MKSKIPKHLTAESRKFWKMIVNQFGIDDAPGLKILQSALEAWDRAQAAREQILRDGMTVIDKAGQTKSHPLLPIERDSRAAFLSALKQLNLDLEPLNARPGRPRGAHNAE